MCPVARRRRGLRRDLNGSALPTLPQSVSRGARFRGFTGSRLLRPVRLLAPWTDRTKFPWPTRGFYIQASGGSVTLPVAGYDYNSTGLLCWRDFHPQEWQLASLHQILRAGMAGVIGDVLAQPGPERLHGHQIRAVARQRHQRDAQGRGRLPDGLGPVIRRAVPEHDPRLIGERGPQPPQDLNRVFAVGARERPQPHLALVVEIQPIERDPRRQARRA